MLLDHDEHARWARTADRELTVAWRLLAGDLHEAVVLHAEQAVQCSLKALLHGVGATREARSHDLRDLARRGAERAGLALEERDVRALRDLALEYLPSRYPDAVPAGGAPQDVFDRDDATRALRLALHVRRRAAEAWRGLVTAESATGPRDGAG